MVMVAAPPPLLGVNLTFFVDSQSADVKVMRDGLTLTFVPENSTTTSLVGGTALPSSLMV